jgi:diaminopimelate decarboxylase
MDPLINTLINSLTPVAADGKTPNQHVAPWTYTVNPHTHRASVGGVDLLGLASTYGTPLYALDGAGIQAMAAAYQDTLTQHYPGEFKVLYASKANLCKGLAQRMHQLGLGLDVVSGGEIYTALQGKVPAENLFFNGNNKSAEELSMALLNHVGRITVDNLTELDLLAKTARSLGKKVRILMRITPGIDCHTHDYIRTGQVDSKFGLNLSDIEPAVSKITGEYADCITLTGLHAHIGSQIFELQPYLDLADTLLNWYCTLRDKFEGLILPDLNIGGGLGIAYTVKDDPLNVSTVLQHVCQHITAACQQRAYPLPRLLLEPGRSMVATSGITLYTLGSVKHVPEVRTYLAVDGGMGDNIRPSLYGATYTAQVLNHLDKEMDSKATDNATPPKADTMPVRIAGKYCESGDILINELHVPTVTQAGDTLVVFGTGAYNYSMSSTYNRVPRPAMVWLQDGQVIPLVRRETYKDLVSLDC